MVMRVQLLLPSITLLLRCRYSTSATTVSAEPLLVEILECNKISLLALLI